MTAASLARRFRERFGDAPRLFRAPGRINLIGEHTDYNDGFVMPAAIDLATWAAAAPRAGRHVRVASLTYGEEIAFDLDAAPPVRPPGNCWVDYVWGVAMVLERAGYHLGGADLMIASEVPIGSGLSSSAAVEVAVAAALLGTSGIDVPRLDLARLCQRAEHEYAGTRCGLMDQFACCFGEEGRALLLDCRSLHCRALRIPPHACLLVANTMVKHDLAAGEYNLRRQACEEAAHRLGVAALRDVAEVDSLLPEPMRRRARHVVTENARVLRAAEALAAGDLATCGALMNESHRSLRDDFEVSCPELDQMVDAALAQPGVYGSRLMGGGFGGCTITLADAARAAAIQQGMAEAYERSTGIRPALYVCRAVAGASEEAVPE